MMYRTNRVLTVALGIAGLLLSGVSAVTHAQSLTAGAIRGTIRTGAGEPVIGAQVTLEASDGSAIRTAEVDPAGEFRFGLLGPGTYRVLAEQVGFQPVRRTTVMVSAGRTTTLAILLERRPPPITSVTDIGDPAGPAGGSLARVIQARELTSLDVGRDLASATRGVSEVITPDIGGSGFAVGAAGRSADASRLFIDGVPVPLWRHPGIRGLAAASPLFQRRGLDQAQLVSVPADAEWRGTAGVLLDGQSRRGSNKVRFEPYLAASGARFGGLTEQNPADSAANSFDGGFVLSGALVPDTAHFVIRADFQSLKTPSAFPWEHDEAVYRGTAGSLRALLPQIAADSFGATVNASAAPLVRTWRGGSGSGNLTWQLSPRNLVAARVGFSTWKETGPDLAIDAGNEAGAVHRARDLGGALALTTTGAALANELRIGVAVSRREWLGSTIATSYLAANGIRFGGVPALPAEFEQRVFSISDALQLTRGRHNFKLGFSIDAASHDQDFRYGSAGVFTFGGLDQFGAGRGFFFGTTGAELPARFKTTDFGVFVQDAFRVTPEIELLLGVRYETQKLPEDEIQPSPRWLALSGIVSDSTPRKRGGVSPRFGFTWDIRNQGTWVVEGGAGLHHTGIDPLLFGEAIQYSSGLRARRGVGVFDNWPSLPATSLAPDVGARLTMFSSNYRSPRTLKAGLGIRGQLSGGLTLRVAGGYSHGDYLPRRVDLNRAPGTIAVTQEGRAVYGTLVKQGGLVAADPGSNRRFGEFDLVSALTPTGFSDHYEVTASLERQVSRALSFLASYTYSKTRDNLVGLLAIDPADQLSPFPDKLNGADWDEGRSDLDVPHRLAAGAEYRSGGRMPITLSARYRWRSGLPFTPGFQPGVDINGDGGAGNDPAFVDAGVAGVQNVLGQVTCDLALNAFAVRNSCRMDPAHGLDVGLRIGLPMGAMGARLMVTVDAFNVISSKQGVVDRALFSVDPAGALVSSGARTVTVPLIANSSFGTLASRRGDPRLIRLGLGIEY